ncbi:MAG TPA: hypothetical protein VG900_01350 [Hyphomicrobiaceae bacterium]|nr:hypothetical protein [Hyphomicrobiaceae bacterium]
MHGDGSWHALRRELRALMETVAEELRTYPPPIPACDAQFNHLLELRRLLPQELERLEAAAGDPHMTVREFIASSPCGSAIRARCPG